MVNWGLSAEPLRQQTLGLGQQAVLEDYQTLLDKPIVLILGLRDDWVFRPPCLQISTYMCYYIFIT